MNLYLIDGHSYFYRAFHAIRDLSNSKGFPTNAIFGFTNMLFKLLREKKPDAIAIVLDSPVPTARHELYEKYKAQRPEMPNDLILQIPQLKKVIKAFKIPSFEMPGYEADDVLCSLAKRAAAGGIDVYILSGDKDMMQAVGKRITIYDPMKEVIIDEAAVIERFGVPPERVVEIMALTGDVADNIPGVKGIGEKTAKELISNAASLDELIAHPEKIINERIRKMIAGSIDMIRLSRTLATIDFNLPVEFNLDQLAVKDPDWQELLRIFSEFELRSLVRMVPACGHAQRAEYITVTNKDDLMKLLGIRA
ncbi:MAG TPA: 5'-3' exonuclease H3TH domain-containing protein [Dissulfurispiraceae bacterium]|nr:5'-3' exonuclease H3TH domain-containing protein [Dissulfurispiraceae bacterium]